MIESKTEYPVPTGRSGTTWTKSLQVGGLMIRSAVRRLQTLPGSQAAYRLKSALVLVKDVAGSIPLQAMLSRLLRLIRSGIGDGPLLNRFALHLVVIFLAVGVVGVSQVRIPVIDFLLPVPTPAPDLGDHTVTDSPSSRGGTALVRNDNILFAAPVPHTTIPERERTTVITYTVQVNDNLWAIAQTMGLQVETLLWANPSVEQDPDLLAVDQVLVVPPVDGVYYTVKKGDTVAKLAKTYKTTVEKIVSFASNGLAEPYQLAVGQQLMLPDGKKPVPPSVPIYPMTYVGSAPKGSPKGSGRFAWPTRGTLTQRYWTLHLGIDIANSKGTPVLAADAGYVVMAGLDTWGYGNQVVIDHGNGYWTRYAHLDKILVTAGDAVTKNQKIGTMGNTGRSTGPHLHFEVILNRTQRNPMSYLP